MARFVPLTVSAVRPEGEGAVCVTFDAPEGWRHLPGQYLTLRRPGGDVRRSYSIASKPGALSVGIRRVEGGVFSEWAQGLVPGDVVEAMPPEGRFTLGGERRVLLVAAGSGITPMIAIAAAVLERGGAAVLVYGNRGTATMMFKDAIEAMKDRYMGRFRAIHVLSREAQDVEVLNGRVDAAKLRDLAARGLIDADVDAAFLCGPGDMIEAARGALAEMGLPPERIRSERFAPAGAPSPPARTPAPVPEGAEVEVVLDGARRRFAMGDAATVLDAAEAAGLELPWSCRGGMCCTCRCHVAEGAVEMAVNYSLEPWEVEAGYVLGCQSRPVTDRLVLDFDRA